MNTAEITRNNFSCAVSWGDYSSVLWAGETFLITSKLPFVDNSRSFGNPSLPRFFPLRPEDWKIIVSDTMIEETFNTFVHLISDE